MKKGVCSVALVFFVLTLFFVSGCTVTKTEKELHIVKSFPKDTAPSQVIKTETRWVMLHNAYGSQEYTVSAGENLDSTKTVYEVNDVSIWYFEANDQAVVWCEKSSAFYTYKAHVFETQETNTIFQISVDTGYQPQNVGIFLGTVYFCTIDYEQQQARVLAYDLDAKTTEAYCTTAFREERQPYSINVEKEYLCFACSDQIKVLNLQNRETVFNSALSESVKYVFGVSYDSKNDTCALYYADGDGEDIGVLTEGGRLCSVFTFSKNHYAYQDKLECDNGHIYWIAQANVSGSVTDHYTLIDYNYLKHKAVETERTFGFCRSENGLYTLRFNKDGDYTHINLCQ